MNSTSSNTPILPGATVGILGGGQLGKMTAQALQRLGYEVVIFCESAEEPAVKVTNRSVIAKYDDKKALKQFGGMCQVITSEFENIPASTLQYLSELTLVHPRAHVFEVAQDRLLEKKTAQKLGIPTVEYRNVEIAEDLFHVPPGRYILKTRKLGYDGKGQILVTTEKEAREAWHKLNEMPCVLETYLPFDSEVSVIVARDEVGKMVNFPMVRNQHRDGILDRTFYPAYGPIDSRGGSIEEQAITIAQSLAVHLRVVGLLAVEMFVSRQGEVYFNEIAPRPHNSGHWTIEGCDISQFEMLVRAICGLPLLMPMPRVPHSALMKNLIGEYSDDLARYLSTGAHLHLYGKKQARSGRKMGHITFIE